MKANRVKFWFCLPVFFLLVFNLYGQQPYENISQNKQLSRSHTKKALVRLRLKDYDGVLNHTAKAIAYYPSNKEAYRLQINANSEKKNYSAVIEDCKKYLQLVPGDAGIYAYQALAMLETGNPQKSYEAASTAVELNPNIAFAYFVRSKSLLVLTDYPKMLEDMYLAAKLDANYTAGFLKLYKKYKKSAGDFKYRGDLRYPKEQPQKPQDKKIAFTGIAFLLLILTAGGTAFFLLRRKKPAITKTPGRLLKQYKILDKIAEGGMGLVYKGFDEVLNRTVAIKRLRTGFNLTREIKEEMLSEARLVASLKHPNILEIYTVFEEEGSLYLIFEFIEGKTLQEKLAADGALSLKEAVPIFDAVCNALQYAHDHNVIHRDLKPANIMVSRDGTVKVMDFGIAKQAGEKTDGTYSGTPVYMPPEQGRGMIKKESDIYALGVCLYETLTGHVPWELEDSSANKITPPSQVVPSIPPQIDSLIEKALETNPLKRLKTAAQFCQILDSID
jgi:tRNA A-37 threonylcarbamoyl transferase component Bud32